MCKARDSYKKAIFLKCKGYDGCYSKEGIQMSTSTLSIIVRETQIKATVKYHLTSVEMKTQATGGDQCGKTEACLLLCVCKFV